jgi:hypothetical protein
MSLTSAETRNVELAELAALTQLKWRDFDSFVRRRGKTTWVFRGVSDKDFRLTPKVGRNPKRYNTSSEEMLLAAFIAQAQTHLINRPFEVNAWDWLALAQHHGLPTRLLDWTTNPLVALLFAVMENPTKDARIYAVEAANIVSKSEEIPFDVKEVAFFRPGQFIPRITSQSGLFSVHPDPVEAWRPTDSYLQENSFVIPHAIKPAFQKRLEQYNITAATLMADLDGISKSLSWYYENGFDIPRYS